MSASPPPAPAQYRFSFDGRYLKFVTRCLLMALMPVCRGVGGGPAGCCANSASISSNVRGGRSVDGATAASVTGASLGCSENTCEVPSEGNSAEAAVALLGVGVALDWARDTPVVITITATTKNACLITGRIDSSQVFKHDHRSRRRDEWPLARKPEAHVDHEGRKGSEPRRAEPSADYWSERVRGARLRHEEPLVWRSRVLLV